MNAIPTILDATVAVDSGVPAMELIDRPARAAISHSLGTWLVSRQLAMPVPLDEFVVNGQRALSTLPVTQRERLMVMAASLLEMPLGAIRVKERLGRVVWLSFEADPRPRETQRDPELPIFLGELSQTTMQALRAYAQQIMNYSPRDYNEAKRDWWRVTRRTCDAVLSALANDQYVTSMYAEELIYYIRKLELPLAFPAGISAASAEGRFLGLSR